MEVDPYFAPPDPSGEVTFPAVPDDPSGVSALPITSAEGDRPSTKARAAMVVAVALVAVAGLFFVGRWTTGGERDTLAEQRDAALAERDHVQRSLDELQSELSDATATNVADQSTIDELESGLARAAAEVSSLQAGVSRLTDQSEKLLGSNTELRDHIDAVGECGTTVRLADTVIDKWDAWFAALGVYANTDVGTEEDRQAGEALDQAWADKDAAESDYVASAALCAQAVERLPDCAEQVSVDVSIAPVTDSDPGSPCPAD